MIPFRFLLIFLFTSLLLSATIYEDAEDSKISRWKLLNADTFISVHNLHDLHKKSRIIKFQGKGTKHAYGLKVKKQLEPEYWLSWQMKFSEDFVIIVVLNTNVGERYLIYTPGIYNSYMQYGLGYASTDGEWLTIRRNLQDDIAYFDNRVKLISLKSFVIKGNGKIDNIITEKVKLIRKNKLPKKQKQKKYNQKKVFKKATNTLPIIKVEGAKLVQMALGEAYLEEGVSAYDKEDGDINVVSMENIDSYEAGRYMVLYMATDSHGNMALDKRYVHVGHVEVEETRVVLEDEDEDDEEDEDEEDDKVNLSEEEEQIRIWEKELELREKELLEKREE